MPKKEYEGEEKRKNQPCDICVKEDFATVKRLVFVILAACVISGSMGGWAALADSSKDGQQDSRLTAIETHMQYQNLKLDELVDLAKARNKALNKK